MYTEKKDKYKIKLYIIIILQYISNYIIICLKWKCNKKY